MWFIFSLPAETNVSWVSHEGSSALLLAAEQGHSTATAILLKHGANPDQADSMQNTPLHMGNCLNLSEKVVLIPVD